MPCPVMSCDVLCTGRAGMVNHVSCVPSRNGWCLGSCMKLTKERYSRLIHRCPLIMAGAWGREKVCPPNPMENFQISHIRAYKSTPLHSCSNMCDSKTTMCMPWLGLACLYELLAASTIYDQWSRSLHMRGNSSEKNEPQVKPHRATTP